MSILSKIKDAVLKFLNNSFSLDELVNYIFSNESLPSPLDSKEEDNLINMLSGVNRDYARTELIEHNLRLVLYIAKRFETSKVELEDLVSVGVIGLVKAIDSFKSDKNIKLATYASRCIENEILMHLRKVNRTQNDISLDEPLSVDDEGSELVISDIIPSTDDLYGSIEMEDEKKYLINTLTSLDEREKQIMILRYGLNGQDELTQKEVADLMDISQSYISRLEKRILKKLKSQMNKGLKNARLSHDCNHRCYC